MPNISPAAIPVDEPIVATNDVPELHVPPPASVNVVVVPSQKEAGPLMADGNGFTVTTVLTVQPVPNE